MAWYYQGKSTFRAWIELVFGEISSFPAQTLSTKERIKASHHIEMTEVLAALYVWHWNANWAPGLVLTPNWNEVRYRLPTCEGEPLDSFVKRWQSHQAGHVCITNATICVHGTCNGFNLITISWVNPRPSRVCRSSITTFPVLICQANPLLSKHLYQWILFLPSYSLTKDVQHQRITEPI